MGYAICTGSCAACGAVFSFNPHKVPSLRVEGVRRPICLGCINAANEVRKANGVPALTVLPGAYEAIEESEL